MSVTIVYFMLPCAMIIYGIYRIDHIPQMNSKVGFRTNYALISEESYYYANIKINEYYIRFNCVIYLIAVAAAIIYLEYGHIISYELKIKFFISLTIVEILGFVIPISIVQRDLKSRYYNEYLRSVIDSHKDIL